MKSQNRRAMRLAGALALGVVFGIPASAQQSEPAPVYHREVFSYDRGGRPDPFRSLLGSADLAIRIEDLVLRGVVYNPNAPASSVAVFGESGSTRRFRAKAGDRIGGIRVLVIRPKSVDVSIEELGVTRRETLQLKAEKGSGS